MAIKVVFVDDSNIILKSIKIFLTDYINIGKIEVSTYSNPVEFYEKIKLSEIDFDILFVDIYMPHLDGYELSRKVREIEHFKNKPIIALTTEISQEAKEGGKKIGINGWITKISSPEVMKDAIMTAIYNNIKR